MFKSTFASVALAGVAAASSVQRGCMLEDPNAVGERSDEHPSYDFYLRSSFTEADVPSHYRVIQVVTCLDWNEGGRLTGFTFTLADPTNANALENNEFIRLPYIGYQSETCAAYPINDRIKKIRTHQTGGDVVTGIGFKGEGQDWIEYNIPSCSGRPICQNNKITWTFDDPNEPVVGMYGMMNGENEITQLGWLQLDVPCQNNFDAGLPGTGGNIRSTTEGDDIAVEIFEENMHSGSGSSGSGQGSSSGSGSGSSSGSGSGSSSGSGFAPSTNTGANADVVSQVYNDYLTNLDFDLSAKFRVSPGDAYVGYPSTEGDDIAVTIFEQNVHTNGITLKAKTLNGQQNYDGYYLGAAAGLMTVLAYSVYVAYQPKEGKTGDATSENEFSLV